MVARDAGIAINSAKGTKKTVCPGGGVYIKANNRGKIITISDEVVIKDNNSAIGGGLYIDSYTTVNEEIVATVNAAIYNNNASKYADDIYTSGHGKLGIKLNLGKTSSWNISCKDTVDGWYLDGENNRWNAHETADTISINPLNELKFTESNSIKAKYVEIDTDKELAEGTYFKEDIEVVYVYQFVKSQGAGENPTVTIEDKPYTGVEESNSYTSVITMISSLTLGTYLVVSKKRFN